MNSDNVLTIKLTGKAFDDDVSILQKHVAIYRELSQKYKLIIVAGGGNLARQYIGKARELGVSSNYWLDIIGINSARLNALLLVSALYPRAYPRILRNVEEIPEALQVAGIVVLGGLIPGQSTAAVAVEAAEAAGSSILIDFSAIDKVYDKDPKIYPDAEPIEKIEASKLLEILKQENLPGQYELIDKRSLELAMRSKIAIYMTHYRKPENIYEILSGKNPGTVIIPA